MPPKDASFHHLSLENPGFAAHPYFWTAFHLRLVKCSFQQVKDNMLVQAHLDRARTLKAEKLAKRPAPNLKSFYVTGLLIRKGFYFAGCLIVLEEGCDIYQIDNNKFMRQPVPTIGYYLYNIDSARRKRLSAPPAPCGLKNEAVERIYNRRLSNITPADWRNDPYMVCLLLSLAQHQWYQRKAPKQEVFPVCLLVTKESDKEHAYIFKADIPLKLLKSLHHPTRNFGEVPSVSWTKVSFEPYSSFSERILLYLVGAQYASELGAVTAARLGGQKRKFGQIEEPLHSAQGC
ncbi:hypothetical protein FSPOR_11468 [Fusarium sporotrichioides]|uniref:Uncharacterized protein n=1 Tax=Fusarium sporotrichioides TaxID=5514 RepID=A0A395RGM3_FUSSP|nr:hypothetical protein FSPOR_11468 [Fusarium sporotrichioides]